MTTEMQIVFDTLEIILESWPQKFNYIQCSNVCEGVKVEEEEDEEERGQHNVKVVKLNYKFPSQ